MQHRHLVDRVDVVGDVGPGVKEAVESPPIPKMVRERLPNGPVFNFDPSMTDSWPLETLDRPVNQLEPGAGVNQLMTSPRVGIAEVPRPQEPARGDS